MAFDQLIELVPLVVNLNDYTLKPLRGGESTLGEEDDLGRREQVTAPYYYYDGAQMASLFVWGEVQVAPVTVPSVASSSLLTQPFFATAWRTPYNPAVVKPTVTGGDGTITLRGWIGAVVGDLTYYIERLEVLQNFKYIDIIAHSGRITSE